MSASHCCPKLRKGAMPVPEPTSIIGTSRSVER